MEPLGCGGSLGEVGHWYHLTSRLRPLLLHLSYHHALFLFLNLEPKQSLLLLGCSLLGIPTQQQENKYRMLYSSLHENVNSRKINYGPDVVHTYNPSHPEVKVGGS